MIKKIVISKAFLIAAFTSLLVTACAAQYGFKGNQNNNADCACGYPHPEPQPSSSPDASPTATPSATPFMSPSPSPSSCHNPPPCTLKVIVNVKEMNIIRSPGKLESVPIQSNEVDLCALSKDFFGVIDAKLNPHWKPEDEVRRVQFVLEDSVGTNRVEQSDGTLVCQMRVPQGETAGIRFEPVGYLGIPVNTPNLVTYEFDETDALHGLGFGICQLQHPVGHYDLIENIGN